LLCFSISKMVSSAIKMLLNLRPCNPGSLRELQPVQKPLQARHPCLVFQTSRLDLCSGAKGESRQSWGSERKEAERTRVAVFGRPVMCDSRR